MVPQPAWSAGFGAQCGTALADGTAAAPDYGAARRPLHPGYESTILSTE